VTKAQAQKLTPGALVFASHLRDERGRPAVGRVVASCRTRPLDKSYFALPIKLGTIQVLITPDNAQDWTTQETSHA
jgi:hypothetical protein